MSRLRWPLAAATGLGLAAGLWAVGRAGLAGIGAAIGRMGWPGFVAYLLSTVPMMVALGAAWAASMRGGAPRPLGLFVWARAVREGANDLLPFSQLGGLVVGTRTLIRAGLDRPRVYAATIVDLTTEMMAQLVLTLFGLWTLGALLVAPGDAARLHRIAMAGTIGIGALTIAFAMLQRPVLRLAALLAGRLLPAAEEAIHAVRLELVAFGRRRLASAPSFLCNMAAWLLSIASAWFALRLLGTDLPYGRMIALEALIFALRSSAFVIPGALGVQEAGYLLLAPLFGLDAQAALALSLVKRGRDIMVGGAALLIWQWREVKGVVRA